VLYDFQTPADLKEFGQIQYSQFGEDVVIWHCLQRIGALRQGGFYVDVGAHHPRRMSNTMLLHHHLGWRGINIEPSRELWAAFEQERPDDINLNIGCGAQNGTLDLTIFDHQAVNSLDAAFVAKQSAKPAFNIVRTEPVTVRRLSEVLEEHLAPDQAIDLLSIDAEGFDLDILRSADLARWRPKVVCLEDHRFQSARPRASAIYRYMVANDYSLHAALSPSLVFKDVRAKLRLDNPSPLAWGLHRLGRRLRDLLP
jgi:FkbM family methyltransferase